MKNQKKHYLIYQITNNINGKIYIGKHETFNIDDNYFGSGKHLKRAQEKYGLENFTKTILFELQNEEEMNLLEKMVVTEEFCKRDDVYNLKEGGKGSWAYACNIISKPGIERDNFIIAVSNGLKKTIRNNGFWWNGKHHTEETKLKMSKSRSKNLGPKTSNYGKMWICNDFTQESKSILKTNPIPDGWRKGRIIKKKPDVSR